MSGICTGIKRDGGPCTLPSNGPAGLCWAHDPANAERRRRGQFRGGRSKPSGEVAQIKRLLSDLADEVLTGTTEPKVGAVVCQIYNTRARLVELERKIRETDELEARLEALEDQQGGTRWRA